MAQDQAVEPKWLLAAQAAVQLLVVLQLLAVDQAVALKSLHAILAALHLAIADVAGKLANMVCLLRFSSARAAAIQLRAVIQVAAHVDRLQADAARVAVQQYRHQRMLQWLLQHQLLTHTLTLTPSVMSFKQAAPEFVNLEFWTACRQT